MITLRIREMAFSIIWSDHHRYPDPVWAAVLGPEDIRILEAKTGALQADSRARKDTE